MSRRAKDIASRSGAVARASLGILIALALVGPVGAEPVEPSDWRDPTRPAERYAAREADWRQGAVVYQVIVDRFAPSKSLDAKRDLYPAPKRLRAWDETPTRGEYVESAGVWSHEIDFWGGDLHSLSGSLGYFEMLGVDVLYLNPIHAAYTNHKYDAQDYFSVSPEYGNREFLSGLATVLHGYGMHLVLDGVLNHMGRTSPWFEEALADPQSPHRDWFVIDDAYPAGYRAWYNVPNLPELNLENPALRARLWGDPDSLVQGYLREGVDGWRLDVAFDIGYAYLDELTRAAHAAKPGSLVVGEIWNYPAAWIGPLDGVMNMTLRELVLKFVAGDIDPPAMGRDLQLLIDDCGIEGMLRSWVILDNHDTPRLATSIPDEARRHLAQVLQFTLPGSPVLYYGTELGMEGGDDPEQRAPMRWDRANDDNPVFVWTRELLRLRRKHRALSVGDFRVVPTSRLLAYLRFTDRVAETVLVVANPSDETRDETLLLLDSSVMSSAPLRDLLTGEEYRTMAGTITLTIPPRSARILVPQIGPGANDPPGYSPYKRVP